MEEYPVRRKKPCVGKKLQNRSKNGMGSSLPLIENGTWIIRLNFTPNIQ